VAGTLSIAGPGSGISTLTGRGTIGRGGSVTVRARRVTIDRRSAVSATTSGRGAGGDVRIGTRSLRLGDAGTVAADTLGAGNGGNVSVAVTGESATALTILSRGEIAAATTASGNGGRIAVDVAGGLVIDGAGAGSLVTTGIDANADPSSTGNGGDIRVSARSLRLAAAGQIASSTGGAGHGGDISIDVTGEGAAALTIRTSGEIAAGTFGGGNGGRIAVEVAGGLMIDGAGADPQVVTGIGAEANPGSTGNAGSLSVRSGSLTLVDGGAIVSSAVGAVNHRPASTGNAGQVTVAVTGALTIVGSGSRIATATDPATIGNAGSVGVSAGQITLAADGGILSTTAGTGAGGPVEVIARGALLLDGAGDPATQIAASATGPRSGPGGDVTVAAGNLKVEGGAEIASTTAAPGSGGQIAITAAAIVLSGSGPQITALSTGSGDAGPVSVAAARLLLTGGAAISTAAQSANGGDITLSVGGLLYLAGSGITTSVLGAAGNGGNIMIVSGPTVLDHATIKAQAAGGNGGNIRIVAAAFVASTDSLVSASSQKGVSGVVTINGITPLNGALVALSSELRSAVALTENSCAARAGWPQSSLVAAGRGGLPQDPDATLPALYVAGRDIRLAPRPASHRADVGDDLAPTIRVATRCD
jgi:large exoprotein involved in heme utilization and adhesion